MTALNPTLRTFSRFSRVQPITRTNANKNISLTNYSTVGFEKGTLSSQKYFKISFCRSKLFVTLKLSRNLSTSLHSLSRNDLTPTSSNYLCLALTCCSKHNSYSTGASHDKTPTFVPLDVTNYLDCNDSVTVGDLQSTMLVYQDFISENEEQDLLKEIEPYMKRLRYERDHWDNAIHGYRETERRNWSEKNEITLERVRKLAFPPEVSQLAYVHILDIEKKGYIKPHIDSVRFCGNTIAGLCLLSPCVMRLVHDKDKNKMADILLSRRSLYIMRDSARYDYTHEVLPEEDSKFRGQMVPRDRRISVIMRNEPDSKHNAIT